MPVIDAIEFGSSSICPSISLGGISQYDACPWTTTSVPWLVHNISAFPFTSNQTNLPSESQIPIVPYSSKALAYKCPSGVGGIGELGL